MSIGLVVPENERGVVRVFRLELGKNEINSFKAVETLDDGFTRSPINRTLGFDSLDHDYVEVFPVSDLEGTGLAAYLSEGLGVVPDQIAADAERLDALDGYVMVVRSGAFGGHEARLKANYPLEYIGGYLDDTATTELSLPTPPRPAVAADFAARASAPTNAPRHKGGAWRAVLVIVALVASGLMIWKFGAAK